MSETKTSHYITAQAKRRFNIWLLDNNLTVNSFAKKVGVSRQYIQSALNGKISITSTVREWFKKGGYELL